MIIFSSSNIGINSSYGNHNLICATGITWVKLLNEMSFVSVNQFDQVFALSKDKKKMYFRMGIEPGELTGKIWKLIAKVRH